jgi:hypothetical protein
MHRFTELASRSTSFTLMKLDEAENEIIEYLQTSAESRHIKNLQMLQLQRVVTAVGLFSIFDAILQDALSCKDGFKEAKSILLESGFTDLNQEFGDYILAINVLKHGRGRSYDELVVRRASLKFEIKAEDEHFFDEGDISEVSTLIKADTKFVEQCSRVIHEVSEAVQLAKPNVIL